MEFYKFPSIDSFANVYKGGFQRRGNVPYRGKIKLHGTNAAVVIHLNGDVYAQSRTQGLTPENDNYGFAKWVESTKNTWAKNSDDCFTYVLYGEWAGPGIQKNDAVTKIAEKTFFIFGVHYFLDFDQETQTYTGEGFEVNPDFILQSFHLPEGVMVLPWETEEYIFNFNSPDDNKIQLNVINETVEKIGEVDPYIKRLYGIVGPGEGLVFTPITKDLTREEYSRLTFKAKCEVHRVKKTSNSASTNIEIPEGTFEFVEAFVTEARCLQGLTEACGGVADKKKTGHFLKWIMNDIHKESVNEVEAMSIEWKKLAGFVSKAASKWYIAKCEEF